MRKQIFVACLLFITSLCPLIAQDSSAVNPYDNAIKLATSLRPKVKPRRFGIGIRGGISDSLSLFISYRISDRFDLQLGGYGNRTKNDTKYEYLYRIQTEIDARYLSQEKCHLFVGARMVWGRHRWPQEEWGIDWRDGDHYDQYYWHTVTSALRIETPVGIEILPGRFCIQAGLAPLYVQWTKNSEYQRVIYTSLRQHSVETIDTTFISHNFSSSVSLLNTFLSVRVFF